MVFVSGCGGCAGGGVFGEDDCGDNGEGGVDLEGELFGDVATWEGVVGGGGGWRGRGWEGE